MERHDEIAEELIELGAVTELTKGNASVLVPDDATSRVYGIGLSDD